MSSINELKSLVSTRGGFARPTSFLVHLPTSFGKSEPAFIEIGVPNPSEFESNLIGSIESLVPSIPGIFESTPSNRDLNILCKNVDLPGKQVMTVERRHGMELERLAYGYVVPDVNMTFHVLNDYGTINYLNKWRKKSIAEDTGYAAYQKEYATDITIFQLKKPVAAISKNAGPITLDIGIGGTKVYGIRLIDAFPTTVSTINLNNELDGLVEVSVTFSYTNWKKEEFNIVDTLVSANVNLG